MMNDSEALTAKQAVVKAKAYFADLEPGSKHNLQLEGIEHDHDTECWIVTLGHDMRTSHALPENQFDRMLSSLGTGIGRRDLEAFFRSIQRVYHQVIIRPDGNLEAIRPYKVN